jgi:hypothetical protein
MVGTGVGSDNYSKKTSINRMSEINPSRQCRPSWSHMLQTQLSPDAGLRHACDCPIGKSTNDHLNLRSSNKIIEIGKFDPT